LVHYAPFYQDLEIRLNASTKETEGEWTCLFNTRNIESVQKIEKSDLLDFVFDSLKESKENYTFKSFQEYLKGEVDADLAKESDLVLIAPATANIIGKIANGLANDLLTCICLATKAPILIAPAMNTNMYENKSVVRNCKTLKDQGLKFVDPVKGMLACGTHGQGHIAQEEDIIKAVMKYVK